MMKNENDGVRKGEKREKNEKQHPKTGRNSNA